MKKLIIALIIGIPAFAGMTRVEAQITPFKNIVKTNTTVGTATFTAVVLKSGSKSFTIWNQGTGTVYVAFDNTKGIKDTVNVDSIPSGNKMYYDYQSNDTLWLKATVACNVKTVIYYGYGEAVREEYLTNGEPKTIISPRIDTLIYTDSLKAGDSTWSINCRGYDFGILYAIADTSAGTYLDSIELWIVTAAGNEFKIGVKKLLNNTEDSLVTSTVTGKVYMVFSPYIETLKLILSNAIYYATRQWKFELHLYRKR